MFDSLTLQVKMWVQLLIPRIEDGNNFGVSIQVMSLHYKQKEGLRDTFHLSCFICFPFLFEASVGFLKMAFDSPFFFFSPGGDSCRAKNC